MKKGILFFLLFLAQSCKYFKGDNCNNTKIVVGVYKNIYDNQAKNILIIKEDGTFIQEYSKNGISKKNEGTWRFFNESCNLYLDNLKLLHTLSKYEKKLFMENGKYRLKNIVFVEDLPLEFDYYRID